MKITCWPIKKDLAPRLAVIVTVTWHGFEILRCHWSLRLCLRSGQTWDGDTIRDLRSWRSLGCSVRLGHSIGLRHSIRLRHSHRNLTRNHWSNWYLGLRGDFNWIHNNSCPWGLKSINQWKQDITFQKSWKWLVKNLNEISAYTFSL